MTFLLWNRRTICRRSFSDAGTSGGKRRCRDGVEMGLPGLVSTKFGFITRANCFSRRVALKRSRLICRRALRKHQWPVETGRYRMTERRTPRLVEGGGTRDVARAVLWTTVQ